MKIWTEEEDIEILAMVSVGKMLKEIADHFGVSKSAIGGRVFRLNKPKEMVVIEDGAPSRQLAEHELKSLRWFREKEPVAGLDVLGEKPPFDIFPTDRMRSHLCEIGMLERFAPNGLYLYRTTPAGRAVLDAAAQQS